MSDFTYRGKSLEEMQKLNMDEFADLLPARKRRSIKRGLTHAQKKLLKKLRKDGTGRTHARDMIILPEMVGKEVDVYDGEEFVTAEIEAPMIGHYLGEFATTREKVSHSAPGLGATRSSKHVPLK